MDYILVIDAVSTGIRALLFNREGEIEGQEYETIPSVQPQIGYVEYNPEQIWSTTQSVVQRAIEKINSPQNIKGIGITNQRATFTLWEKETGNPVMNFISWADVRSASTSEEMNQNNEGLKLLSTTGIIVQFNTALTIVRLKWVLDNIDGVRRRCERGELLFGTVDTWLIYKLTAGTVHVTDYTNAATGLLDPFQLTWNVPLLKLFDIPQEILPKGFSWICHVSPSPQNRNRPYQSSCAQQGAIPD